MNVTLGPHMREVVFGAGIALALKFVGGGLDFLLNLSVARLLGPHDSGIFFLSITIVTIAATVARLGMGNTMLRYTASNAATGNWQGIIGMYRVGIRISLAASIGISVGVFFLASWFAQALFSKPGLAVPLQLMSIATVPLVVMTLHAQVLRGLKRIFPSQAITGVLMPAFAVIGVWCLAPFDGVRGSAVGYAVGCGLAMLIGVLVWKVKLCGLFDPHYVVAPLQLLKKSFPFFWVDLTAMVMAWTSVIMLGVWGTESEVAIFSVATRTVLLTNLILNVINVAIAPKLAELYKKGSLGELERIVQASTFLMIVMALPVFLLFMTVPMDIMGFFGSGFRSGGLVLVILAAGQVVNVATGSVGYLLMMSEQERVVRNVMLVMAVANVLFGLLLIPRFGMEGAAYGTACTVGFQNLFLVYYVWRRLRIVTVPVNPYRMLNAFRT